MSTQNLSLNVLTFDHPQDQIEVGLYREKKPGMAPLAAYEIPLELFDHFPELAESGLQFLYTDFTKPPDADFHATVDLSRSTRFARHYYSWLIKQYFKDIASISTPNFIRDNEVWFKDKSKSTEEYTTFKKFGIRVYMGRITRYPELVISFEGHTKVLNTPVLDLDVSSKKYKWVIYNREKLKYGELPDEVRLQYENVYPVLNNSLRKELGLQPGYEKVTNKYARYFSLIGEFIQQYLNTDSFRKIIPLYSPRLLPVSDLRIGATSIGSNQLVFGFKKTNTNPFMGLIQNGPFRPSPLAHVRMFFICHQDDTKEVGNTLYKSFRDGHGNFPGMKKFLKLPLSFSKEEQITFTNKDNPLPEIKKQLSNNSYDPEVRYIAIYISPIEKDEQDPLKHRVYYLVKEELLKRGITSQVVERETIHEEGFNYSLPNIGIAILAKLDGIPWRLNRSLYNELVVGVGAFKPTEALNRYIGSAFCFSNDGQFQGFECYAEDDTIMLAGSIRKAVRQYVALHGEVKRLVIHFYKTMSREEMKPILEALHDLDLEIPVVIITINKTQSKDLVVFDTSSKSRMPLSGTFVNVGRNQYLLCNNTRYSSWAKNVDGYPFPVKISIRSSDESILQHSKTIQNLIDQVYQFSRMYWKSVRQQNLPVTIKYPEMVAKIFPHFEGETIPTFGKDNLWFL